MKFIIGKKIGMTKIFESSGKSRGISIVETLPCYVSEIKTVDKNGYDALQIACKEAKRLSKSEKGHLNKLYKENSSAKDKNFKVLKEIKITKDEVQKYKIGDEIKLDIFKAGEKIAIHAVSKGKGFQGTVKRHHFHTGPKTHGSDNYRQPGSIGATYPQRTIKGRRMSGHMGHENVTVKNLVLCDILPDKNLLLIEGSVPGSRGNLVTIEGKI